MKNSICVYDFETDGSNPELCNAVQIAACIINPITLEIVDNSEFCSYMRPENIDDKNYFEDNYATILWHTKNYFPQFYEMNKEKQEEAIVSVYEKWKDAPDTKQVFSDFTTYLLKYNSNHKRHTKFTAPIRAGMNIKNFDNVIMQRLCSKYGYVDSDGKQKIFHPRDQVDILELCYYWFENLTEPKKYNMDALREFFGLDKAGAHDALKDVRDEAMIIQRFMRLHRVTAARVQFKHSMRK